MTGLGSHKNTEGKMFISKMQYQNFHIRLNEPVFTDLSASFFLLQNVCGHVDKPDILGGGRGQLHSAGGF